MVDRAALFEVADALVGEGKVPSQRLIRERLTKGSFSDIGPGFLEWCLLRNFRPRPTRADLPAHLQEKIATMAAEIWRDGHGQGHVAGRNEVASLEVERDTLRLALTEALAIADALAKQVKFLEEDKAERAARQRRRAEEFWDRVMLEIVEILGDRDVGIVEIVARLSPETRREAVAHPDGLEPSRLVQKMRQRITRSKYFEEPAAEVFRRRRPTVEPDAKAPVVMAAKAKRLSLASLARRRAEPNDDSYDL